jgi:hypothetical protein
LRFFRFLVCRYCPVRRREACIDAGEVTTE